MKKLHKIMLMVSLGIFTTGASQAHLLQKATNLDVKQACSIKANCIKSVLATAAKYNAEAIKLGVEFKRLGVTNSNYIKTVTAAVKAKKKKVVLKYKKKGKVKKHKMTTEYAAWRACHFAIRALQQKAEAEDTWKLAVPGSGFKL